MVAEDERQRAVSFENAKPLDSAAFKAFQRKISPYASNKERTGTKIVKDRTEYCTGCRKEGHRREDTPFDNPVIIPNGDSIPVKGKGECILPGGKKINGVLYIPDFK
nr:hypothetical protein [Tanacetum cinerariifolium]